MTVVTLLSCELSWVQHNITVQELPRWQSGQVAQQRAVFVHTQRLHIMRLNLVRSLWGVVRSEPYLPRPTSHSTTVLDLKQ
jgi:hypothetical protein